MYDTNRSLPAKPVSIFISLLFLTLFISSVTALELPFDPNDYNFLVYIPGGTQIDNAMNYIGITNYDRRTAGNPVTPNDLATHDILIVGENSGGDVTGLSANVLNAGITGRIILTGHDLDQHITQEDAAETMFIQAIDYVLQGGETGLIVLACDDEDP